MILLFDGPDVLEDGAELQSVLGDGDTIQAVIRTPEDAKATVEVTFSNQEATTAFIITGKSKNFFPREIASGKEEKINLPNGLFGQHDALFALVYLKPKGGEGERTWRGERYKVPKEHEGNLVFKNRKVFDMVKGIQLHPVEEKIFKEEDMNILKRPYQKTIMVINASQGEDTYLITGTKTAFNAYKLNQAPGPQPIKLQYSKRTKMMNLTTLNEFKFGICHNPDTGRFYSTNPL